VADVLQVVQQSVSRATHRPRARPAFLRRTDITLSGVAIRAHVASRRVLRRSAFSRSLAWRISSNSSAPFKELLICHATRRRSSVCVPTPNRTNPSCHPGSKAARPPAAGLRPEGRDGLLGSCRSIPLHCPHCGPTVKGFRRSRGSRRDRCALCIVGQDHLCSAVALVISVQSQ